MNKIFQIILIVFVFLIGNVNLVFAKKLMSKYQIDALLDDLVTYDNRKNPYMIGDVIRVEKTTRGKRELINNFTMVNFSKKDIETKPKVYEFIKKFHKFASQSFCDIGKKTLIVFKDNDLSHIIIFKDKHGEEVYTFANSADECDKLSK